MIYLASPYTHELSSVMIHRHRKVQAYTASQLKKGVAIFSPIVYGKPMEREVGHTARHWAAFNNSMLPLCSEVWVYCLHGWQDSAGIIAEVKLAETLGIPVRYFEPDGEEINVDY